MLETIRCDDHVNLMAAHYMRDHTDRGQPLILSEQISYPPGFRAKYLGCLSSALSLFQSQ